MSQLEAISEVIDGKQYDMYMLEPLTSHDLFMDVVKMVGPTLGPIFDAAFAGRGSAEGLEDLLEREIGPDFFSNATTKLFGAIDKAVLNKVIAEFRKVTLVDGVELNKTFDVHFKGEIHNMYKWLLFGMKAQWGKSFSALVSGVMTQGAKTMAKKKKESQSQTTLLKTGSNGG